VKDQDKTKIYSDSDKTSIYQGLERRTKPSVHNLHAGDKIVLNGKNYEILEIISESTGEAIIYKIKNDTGEIEALKLYFEFHNPENEPNNEALERIKSIHDEDILRLHDFGTGVNKYQDKYCFEISDFAHGFDLLHVENLTTKYPPDFLESEVIPQIFKGILRLHENKIYHCDLKPQNVFFLDKEQIEIVIGDYGSSKTFEFDAAKSSRKTTTVKGTDFYLPPEQARGFISDKNDYYSFGMILLHLLYPDRILLNLNEPKSLSREKLKNIIERQFEGKPIIEFNPEYQRINQLIEGLTLVDFNLRWGKDEVEKWLDGEEVEINYRQNTESPNPQALKFGGYTINTPEDLRDYILSDTNWYADLIEDTDNRDDFTNWMLGLYNGDKRKRSALNRIIKNYSPEGIDFVGDAVIRFFLPKHPVTFGFKSFDFSHSDELKKTTAEAFSHLLFDLWNNSSDKDIRLYVFRYEFALRQLQVTNEEATNALKKLFNALKPKGVFKNDFAQYRSFTIEKVSKKTQNEIKQFLFDYLSSEANIEFSNIQKYNELHYHLPKSLTSYFNQIGINQNLQERKSNKLLKINFPSEYSSYDDFCDKTIESILNDISFENSIDKQLITESSTDKFAKDFRNTYNKLIGHLSNEYNDLKKEFGRFKELRNQFNQLQIIITKEYNRIPSEYNLIHSIRKKGEQLEEKEYRELAREKSLRKIRRKNNIRIFVRCLLLLIVILFFWPLYKVNRNVYSNVMLLKGVELVPVEGGTYKMGRSKGNWNERPSHTVMLDDFYISKYEITNAQFARFLTDYQAEVVKSGEDSSELMIELNNWNIEREDTVWKPVSGWEDKPVGSVSWFGAKEFAKWAGGRLPTEAEWEYVARGGKNPKVNRLVKSIALDSISWYMNNAGSRPEIVGTKSPNELGVYDLYGNVWEWCADWYDAKYYSKSPRNNPCNTRKPYSKNPKKVIRGGAYHSYSKEANPFYRDKRDPGEMHRSQGFRICWVNQYNKEK
jgi:formylglycine-generating enzyme required for sulfatase activity/serine/threonine protein kinase